MKSFGLNRDAFIKWLLFAVVCSSFCYIMAIYPYAQDDLEFRYFALTKGLKYQLTTVFSIDNGRIGNSIAICLLLVPKWIPTLIQCVALLLGVRLMMGFAGIKNWRLASLFFFLFVFAPVWQDNMFCLAYAFNYIVPIPLLFVTIFLYNHPDKFPLWVGVILSFLTGAWHESFGLVIVAGWGMMWLFNRKSLTSRNQWLLFAVVLGTLWNFVNPGVWSRVAIHTGSSANYFRLLFCWLYFLYIFIWGVCMINRETRHIAREPFNVFAVGGFILLPMVAFTGFERAAMPAILVCCCAATKLFPVCWTILIGKASSFVKSFSSASMVVIIIAHLIFVDCEATVQLPMYENICKEIKDTPTGQMYVFVPMRFPWDTNPITLGRPSRILMIPNDWSISFAREVAGERWDVDPVPQELRNYTANSGNAVSDNSNIREWNGHLVSSDLADTLIDATYTKYKGGRKSEFAHVLTAVFTADDGKRYVYVLPQRSIISNFLGKPIEVECIKR